MRQGKKVEQLDFNKTPATTLEGADKKPEQIDQGKEPEIASGNHRN